LNPHGGSVGFTMELPGLDVRLVGETSRS